MFPPRRPGMGLPGPSVVQLRQHGRDICSAPERDVERRRRQHRLAFARGRQGGGLGGGFGGHCGRVVFGIDEAWA